MANTENSAVDATDCGRPLFLPTQSLDRINPLDVCDKNCTHSYTAFERQETQCDLRREEAAPIFVIASLCSSHWLDVPQLARAVRLKMPTSYF